MGENIVPNFKSSKEINLNKLLISIDRNLNFK